MCMVRRLDEIFDDWLVTDAVDSMSWSSLKLNVEPSILGRLGNCSWLLGNNMYLFGGLVNQQCLSEVVELNTGI